MRRNWRIGIAPEYAPHAVWRKRGEIRHLQLEHELTRTISEEGLTDRHPLDVHIAFEGRADLIAGFILENSQSLSTARTTGGLRDRGVGSARSAGCVCCAHTICVSRSCVSGTVDVPARIASKSCNHLLGAPGAAVDRVAGDRRAAVFRLRPRNSADRAVPRDCQTWRAGDSRLRWIRAEE